MYITRLFVRCPSFRLSYSFRTWYQQRIDRGSMQMVEHQMIFSSERKKQWSHNEYSKSLILSYPIININNLLTLLAADPPSSQPEWVLLHFFSCFPHLCWVPTDSSPWVRRAGPLTPLCLQTGSRKFLIQATARFFVGHNTVVPSFLVTVKFHEVSLPCSLQFFLIAVFSYSVALCNVHCPSLHPSITVEHPHCFSAALSSLSFLTTSYNIPTALSLQHPHFLFITSSSLPFHYHIPIFFSLHHLHCPFITKFPFSFH